MPQRRRSSYPVAVPFESLANRYLIALFAQVAILGYFLAYLYLALRRVYEATRLATLARMAVAVLAYLMIVSVSIETFSSFLIIRD